MFFYKRPKVLFSMLVLILFVLSGCGPVEEVAPQPQDSPTVIEAGQFNEVSEEVTDMQVTVQVELETARALHQLAPPTPESQELLQIAQTLGVVLEPMHPGIDDPLLLPFFTVSVPDEATAQQVIAELQQSKAVEGAYVEPRPDLP